MFIVCCFLCFALSFFLSFFLSFYSYIFVWMVAVYLVYQRPLFSLLLSHCSISRRVFFAIICYLLLLSLLFITDFVFRLHFLRIVLRFSGFLSSLCFSALFYGFLSAFHFQEFIMFIFLISLICKKRTIYFNFHRIFIVIYSKYRLLYSLLFYCY